MRGDAGRTDSLWAGTKDIAADGPLEGDTHADVCIVGAGVVGLCTAYALMRDGRNVVVLDDGPIAGGETGRTTAHISNALDDGFAELQRRLGPQGARRAAESHTQAVDWLEELIQETGISCGWRRLDGYLGLSEDKPEQVLLREFRAARECGLDVERVDRPPLGAWDVPALRFPAQGRLDPSAFARGLVSALRAGGVRIHTPSHAARVEDDGRAVVTGAGHVVRCTHVVEATNAPIFGHNNLFLRQAPHRTYAIAMAAPEGTADALFWDTAKPYHYVRLADRHLVVGGGDHPTGHRPEKEPFGGLEAWVRERVPGLGAVSHRWSGQIWEPADGMAFIGRAGRTLVATGDSGHGWTHAAIAARLLGDIVAGRSNAHADLYDPKRVAGGAGTWLKQAGHMVGTLPRVLMPGEVDDPEAIAAGQGAIVRRGIRLLACHRDEEGVLHQRSAVCRHMGCIVDWNAIEKSWDCPCHGSRYDALGTVINGPSNHDLGDEAPRRDGIRAAPPVESAPEGPASGNAPLDADALREARRREH